MSKIVITKKDLEDEIVEMRERIANFSSQAHEYRFKISTLDAKIVELESKKNQLASDLIYYKQLACEYKGYKIAVETLLQKTHPDKEKNHDILIHSNTTDYFNNNKRR